MAAGRADSAGPATGTTVFTDWVREHASDLGRAYANELDRHFRRPGGQARGQRTSAEPAAGPAAGEMRA